MKYGCKITYLGLSSNRGHVTVMNLAKKPLAEQTPCFPAPSPHHLTHLTPQQQGPHLTDALPQTLPHRCFEG